MSTKYVGCLHRYRTIDIRYHTFGVTNDKTILHKSSFQNVEIIDNRYFVVQSCISTESACFPGSSYAQVRGPHISKRCRGAAATLQTIFHIVDIAAETRSQGAGGDGDITDTQDAALRHY